MFFKYSQLAIIWTLLLLALCAVPGGDIPDSGIKNLDKPIHFFMYVGFSHLWIVAFLKQYSFKILRYYAVAIAVGSGIIYGILLEIAQSTIFTDRAFEWYDILANSAGAIFGVLTFRALYGFFPRK